MILPVKTAFEGSEMNPQFVNIVAPSELVIRIELSIEIDNFSDKILICIPYSMVEPVKEKLHSSFQSDTLEQDNRWVDMIRGLLLESSVEVSVELGRARVTLADLRDLRPDDVLILDTDKDGDLVMTVQNVPKYLVRPGQRHGAQAVQVTALLTGKEA